MENDREGFYREGSGREGSSMVTEVEGATLVASTKRVMLVGVAKCSWHVVKASNSCLP